MARFLGKVRGGQGEASRLGHKTTGLRVTAASVEGAVTVMLAHNPTTGHDYAEVRLHPWQGAGRDVTLYVGRVDGKGAKRIVYWKKPEDA